jgi:glycosyltransferase involved in cell wall biosynthesis
MTLPEYSALRFTAVGGDFDSFARDQGGELGELWANLRRDHSDQITMTGPVDESEKNRLLASAHWVVVPSRFESFGLVAVEAMRTGTPVLAADAGGLGEVARLGPCNVLFTPSDIAGLAGAIRQACVLGPKNALGLRASTRAAYLHQFRSDLMIDRSLKLYGELLGTSRRSLAVVPTRES